jgi:peptidoglycan/LPS O-acetylase OafA/YrhL
LYLVHQRIGTITLRAAHDAGIAPWAQVAAAVALTGVLAWLVHRYIEVPGRALIKAALARRVPVPVATAASHDA